MYLFFSLRKKFFPAFPPEKYDESGENIPTISIWGNKRISLMVRTKVGCHGNDFDRMMALTSAENSMLSCQVDEKEKQRRLIYCNLKITTFEESELMFAVVFFCSDFRNQAKSTRQWRHSIK